MALMPLLLFPAAFFAAPAVIQECDRVEVIAPEEAAGLRVARIVCGSKPKLEVLFGIKSRVRVRICADMRCWRSGSRRPAYISAALVSDEEILTQPPGSLRKIEDLEGTLVHELVHLLIRRVAGRNCPRWLDEGLALWLSGQRAVGEADLPRSEGELARIEKRLRSGKTTREQLLKDYAICRLLVKKLVDQVGEQALVRALSGLKRAANPLDLPVKEKPLRSRLFSRSSTHPSRQPRSAE